MSDKKTADKAPAPEKDPSPTEVAAAATDAANKAMPTPPQPLGDDTPTYSLRIAKEQPNTWDSVDVAGMVFTHEPSKVKYTKLQAREFLAAVDPDGRPYLETV